LGPESYDNDCPLDSTAPSNAIAPFWDDGYADTGAVMQYKTEGTAPFRKFSVEWQNWDMWHCQTGGMNCFELNTSVTQTAILYENGDIEFRYGPRTAPADPRGCNTQHTGCSATIGIEGNVSGTADVDQKQCNTNGITEG